MATNLRYENFSLKKDTAMTDHKICSKYDSAVALTTLMNCKEYMNSKDPDALKNPLMICKFSWGVLNIWIPSLNTHGVTTIKQSNL